MTRSRNHFLRRLATCAITLLAVCSVGCTSFQTETAPKTAYDPTKKNDISIDGAVYYLPKSLLNIGLESKKKADGNHSELVIRVGTETVPDTETSFILKRSGNELFKRNHHIVFTNGLIHSIKTEDEGKAGQVVEDLASIAFNVLSFGALPAPFAAAAPGGVVDDDAPSAEEIAAALTSITPGENTYMSELPPDPQNTPLPGTGGLVTFSAAMPALPVNPIPNHGANAVKAFDGVLVKLLEPHAVRISVNIDKAQLYLNRMSAGAAQVRTLQKLTNELPATIAKLEKKRDATADAALKLEIQDQIDAQKKKLDEAIDVIHDSQAVIVSNTARYDAFKNRPVTDPTRYYEISQRSFSILAPDFSPFVRLSLLRAPLGITKYEVLFNKGTLADFNAENPSTVLEVFKVPLNMSKALVALPAEILKLKFDYSSKAKELAAAEKDRLKALEDLAKQGAAQTEHEKTISTLQQEQELLKLREEIAKLKKALNDLEIK